MSGAVPLQFLLLQHTNNVLAAASEDEEITEGQIHMHEQNVMAPPPHAHGPRQVQKQVEPKHAHTIEQQHPQVRECQEQYCIPKLPSATGNYIVTGPRRGPLTQPRY